MFEAKVHEISVPLGGDPAAALDVARIALLSLGFEILADSEAELCARGPGMQSNRQPALLGATELSLHVTSSSVDARATLGGVSSMKAFLFLFPPGLALGLAIVFALLEMPEWWVAALSVAPWLVLSPWIASLVERRAIQAVDHLVSGMAGARARSA